MRATTDEVREAGDIPVEMLGLMYPGHINPVSIRPE